ncbi:MAG: GNAT family N-acetyltransferase [Gammaproteobacteria bacterium]
MAAIRLEVVENTLTDPGRVSRGMYHDYLTTSGRGWLCEVNRRAVGFSVASLDDKTIWALFVHPEFEGRGIGKELLTLAVDWLFEQGAESISLTTDPDTRAERLYQAAGWERGEHIANGEIRYRLSRVR